MKITIIIIIIIIENIKKWKKIQKNDVYIEQDKSLGKQILLIQFLYLLQE